MDYNKDIASLDDLNRDHIVLVKQIASDPLIKLKKYDGATSNIGASIDRNGRAVTGLTEDRKTEAQPGKPLRTIRGTRPALESLLGLPEGTLKVSAPYWNTYSVKIGADVLRLDLADDMDLLKFLFLKAQSNVAKGVNDIGRSPDIEFVMYSEEQEAVQRNKTRSTLKEAYIASSKLDLQTQIDILAVYGTIASGTKASIVQDKLDEAIEADPKKFLSILEDSNLEVRALLKKALDRGVLTAENGAINHGEVSVGYDLDNATINTAKNLKLQAIIRAKLTGDMDLISEALGSPESKVEVESLDLADAILDMPTASSVKAPKQRKPKAPTAEDSSPV